MIVQKNEMAVVMADLENDSLKGKKAKKEENQAKKAARNEKNKKWLEEERKKASKVRETNAKIIDESKKNGLTHVAKLHVKQLWEILRYHFLDDQSMDQKLWKANFIIIVCKLLKRKCASG